MQKITTFAGGVLMAAIMGTTLAGPATAVTLKECSTKYQAAKTDGTLAGANWKSFRAAQCSSGSSTTASEAAPASAAAASPAATTATAPATMSKPASMAASSGTATFPGAIDPKYAKETAGKGRMHTCLDQYRANKASNGNGGLRWIQKGGGYYSECTKKLKA